MRLGAQRDRPGLRKKATATGGRLNAQRLHNTRTVRLRRVGDSLPGAELHESTPTSVKQTQQTSTHRHVHTHTAAAIRDSAKTRPQRSSPCLRIR